MSDPGEEKISPKIPLFTPTKCRMSCGEGLGVSWQGQGNAGGGRWWLLAAVVSPKGVVGLSVAKAALYNFSERRL